MKSFTVVAVAAVALVWLDSTVLAQPVTPTFNDVVIGNVPLDAGGTYTLHIDIYAATAGAGPRPIVLWIHGGGWSGGTYNSVPPYALLLRGRGIHIAGVDYRLSQQAIFPAQIHDVKGAVRFLRANAVTYGISPARIGAWGSSAGGHLTALLGTSAGVAAAEGTSGGNLGQPSIIQAAVDFFGPTDLLQINLDVTTPPGSTINHDAPNSPESRLIGFDDPDQGIGVLRDNVGNPNPPFPEKVALITLVNPITHVTVDDPPLFISHGTSDTSVPIRQSERLYDALAPLGTDVTYLPVIGAGHGALGASAEAAAREFLVWRLLPRTPGDMNCDGAVDTADVGPFVQMLVAPSAYAETRPTCNPANGDLDDSFTVDGVDVPLFVDAVLGA